MARHFHVLWAVDALAEHKEIQMRTARALKALLKDLDAEVEPVTVFSPDQIQVLEPAFRRHAAEHRGDIEKVLMEWSREAAFTETRAPRVLTQEEYSVSQSTSCLLDHARETGANLIALGTSGKHGLARAVLGSFAESLALQSETPLFVVNANARPVADIQKILFPTDFSESGRRALDQLLPVAAAKQAHIVLFYKLEYLVPGTHTAIANYPPYKAYMDQDVAEKQTTAEQWRQLAAGQGVSADIVFDKATNYVVDAILEAAAKMNNGMIAMASRRGRAAVLLGSVTRDLIRRSPQPIWVIHPHEAAKPQ